VSDIVDMLVFLMLQRFKNRTFCHQVEKMRIILMWWKVWKKHSILLQYVNVNIL